MGLPSCLRRNLPSYLTTLAIAGVSGFTANPWAAELGDPPNGNPNPAATTIVISTPDVVNTASPYTNLGTIQIEASGTLTNEGSLVIGYSDVDEMGNSEGPNSARGVITNLGSFVNAGSVLMERAEVYSAGQFTNSGTLGVGRSDGVLRIGGSGTNTNSGSIIVDEDVGVGRLQLLVEDSATFLNATGGLISFTQANHGAFEIGASATFVNQNGATIVTGNSPVAPPNPGVIYNKGTFTNETGGNILGAGFGTSGIFHNAGNIDLYHPFFGGGLVNDGSFDNSGTIVTNTLWLGNVSGTSLQNSGSIDTIGLLILGADATILNEGTLSAGFLSTERTSTITNTGVIDIDQTPAGDTGGVSGRLLNSGTFNLASTAYLRNSIDSAPFPNGVGTIENLAGGTITVDGTIENNTDETEPDFPSTMLNAGDVVIATTGQITGTGAYTQTAGSTKVNGLLDQPVVNINGGTLSGTGIVKGTVNGAAEVNIGPDGHLSPGNSPGTLIIDGNLNLDGGTIDIEFGKDSGGNVISDVLSVTGDASFLAGGAFVFHFLDGLTPADIVTFAFLDIGGNIAGQDATHTGFENVTFLVAGGLPPLVGSFAIGDAIVEFEATTAVPLPAAPLLMSSGLLLLFGVGVGEV